MRLRRSRLFSKQKTISSKTDPELNNTIEWIVPNAQKNIMEPIRLTLGPGGTTYMDLPHEGEEFGYVLTGRVTIHIGNKSYKAKKGETFYLIPNKSHYLENTGKTPAPGSLDQLAPKLLINHAKEETNDHEQTSHRFTAYFQIL